jgi:hypothetical protein
VKRLITVVALLVFIALPAAAAADLIELKVTDHGTSCFTVNNGTAVECTGKWSGLGSQTTVFTVTAPFTCENNGGNFPPGQAATGQQTVNPTNGAFSFDITTSSVSKSCPDGMKPTFGAATVCAQRTPPVCMTYVVRQ